MNPLKSLSKKFPAKTLIMTLLFNLFFMTITTAVSQKATIPRQNFSNFNSIDRYEKISSFSFSEPEALSHNRMLASTSPTIGQVIEKVSGGANRIVISPNGKIAYFSIAQNGRIEGLDISNLENINYLSVRTSQRTNYKALALSSDGKTLFASNFNTLEIFDVSNRLNIILIGSYLEVLEDSFSSPMIALSADEKFVFTGGEGLNVFDVSNLKENYEYNKTTF